MFYLILYGKNTHHLYFEDLPKSFIPFLIRNSIQFLTRFLAKIPLPLLFLQYLLTYIYFYNFSKTSQYHGVNVPMTQVSESLWCSSVFVANVVPRIPLCIVISYIFILFYLLSISIFFRRRNHGVIFTIYFKNNISRRCDYSYIIINNI